jgi:hypothetical protein
MIGYVRWIGYALDDQVLHEAANWHSIYFKDKGTSARDNKVYIVKYLKSVFAGHVQV